MKVLAGSAGLANVGRFAGRATATRSSTTSAAGWHSYRGGPGNTGLAPATSGIQETYEIQWTTDPDPNTDTYLESTDVVDDSLYAGGEQLHHLDADTGDTRWTFATDASNRDENRFWTPAVDGDTVYVGTGERGGAVGKVYAVDAASGAEQWRFTGPTDHASYKYITVTDGVVLAAKDSISSDYDSLHALDATTGEELWSLSYGSEATTPSRTAPAAATDGTQAYVKTSDALVAVDVQTGETQWRVTGSDGFYTPFAAAAVADGTVYASEAPDPYISDNTTSLYAVDAADGSVQWTFTPDLDGYR